MSRIKIKDIITTSSDLKHLYQDDLSTVIGGSCTNDEWIAIYIALRESGVGSELALRAANCACE